jgi:hypothetical protein
MWKMSVLWALKDRIILSRVHITLKHETVSILNILTE